MTSIYDQLQETAAFIRERIGARAPTVGLILGSGLGGFADRLDDAVVLDYHDIPHFPESKINGHLGRLVVGDLAGASCVVMQGRIHTYEGHSATTVVFPVRTLITLGARTVIVTNAAGGLRHDWEPGTLMLIRDHLNFQHDNPLRGPNDGRLGPRFPDMTFAYDPELRQLVRDTAATVGVPIAEGVYVAMPGPTYETPAEVRMLATLGAHATGMSTVPEVIAANHMGAKVIGISCITNKAAGIAGKALSHDEVTETATQVRDSFARLLEAIIGALVARDAEAAGE